MECGDCLVCRLNENVNCPYCIIKQFGLFEHPTPEPRSNGSRFYNQEEKEKVWHHSEVSQNYHDKNLGSEIEPKVGSQKAQRLIRTHKKYRSKGNSLRNLGHVIGYIRTVISQLRLPNSLFPRTIQLFKEVTKKGWKLEPTSLACLLVASEEARIPISSQELAEFGAERKKILEVKRKILRECDIHTEPLRPVDFINKILSELDKEEWRNEIKEMVEGIKSFGKNPMSVVSGAIWCLNQDNGRELERQEIAEACNVSPQSVYNRSKDF